MKQTGSLILYLCISTASVYAGTDPLVASMLEQSIHASDIEPKGELHQTILSRVPADQKDYYNAMVTKRNLELMIISKLINTALEKNNIQITKQDIEDYRNYNQRETRQKLQKLNASYKNVDKQINQGFRTNPNFNVEYLQSIRQKIESLKKTEVNYNDGSSASEENSEQWVAEMKRYYFYRILYLGLGGRVIFASNGLFPIDAYNKYLGKLIESKSITVHQQKYASIFADRQQFDSAMQSVRTKDEAQRYFERPYWLLTEYPKEIKSRF